MGVGLVFLLLSLASAGQADNAEPQELQRKVDDAAYERCAGGLVGFRNVSVQCIVGANGTLEQCEVQSTNRSVLRYRERFQCMASAVTMTHPDGTPAVGTSVDIRFDYATSLSTRTRYEELSGALRD